MKKDYYVYIDGVKIILPGTIGLDERKQLCNDLFEKYPEAFTYTLPSSSNDNHGEMVERRLDIMGTYILQAEGIYMADGLISEWANRKIRENETYFSDISDEFEEFY